MGYYVRTVESTAYIPAAMVPIAYDVMCALNVTHHAQKRGGRYTAGQQTGAWFSWMDANYPDTCHDAQSILQALGFSAFTDNDGNLWFGEYDSKTGQEDLFLAALELIAIGVIKWEGEDGDTYETVFLGDTVFNGAPPLKLESAQSDQYWCQLYGRV